MDEAGVSDLSDLDLHDIDTAGLEKSPRCAPRMIHSITPAGPPANREVISNATPGNHKVPLAAISSAGRSNS
jgi:hypothetical protein